MTIRIYYTHNHGWEWTITHESGKIEMSDRPFDSAPDAWEDAWESLPEIF